MSVSTAEDPPSPSGHHPFVSYVWKMIRRIHSPPLSWFQKRRPYRSPFEVPFASDLFSAGWRFSRYPPTVGSSATSSRIYPDRSNPRRTSGKADASLPPQTSQRWRFVSRRADLLRIQVPYEELIQRQYIRPGWPPVSTSSSPLIPR